MRNDNEEMREENMDEHNHEHNHDHDHDHNHEHNHNHEHEHGGSSHGAGQLRSRDSHGGKKKITARVRDVPGLIYIERQIHDEAIVVSASLTLKSDVADLNARIAEGLESAAREVNEQGGIVGHIKASVSTTSSCMISVTDESAMIKDSPLRRAQISLASILFLIDPEDAENIVRKALSGIRARSKTNT